VSARQERQLDQLRELCRRGAAGRAVDLAFVHFAEFGRDDSVVALLANAVECPGVPERLRRRLDELRDPRG
jgi:hypothetical protein